MRPWLTTLLLGSALCFGLPASAEDDAPQGHSDAPAAGAHVPEDAAAAGHDAHGAHAPSFHDINWYYGLLGERDGVEPSLLYRPTGTPVPFSALLFNTALLFFVLYKVGARPISEGLKNRKQTLLRGMEESAKMRRDAEAQLKGYQLKLERIEDEIERVKKEMQIAGEIETKHVLGEARERHQRMERDARQLVEQELKAMRDKLHRETVESAVKSAAETLSSKLTPADQERLAEEYVSGLARAAGTLRGRV